MGHERAGPNDASLCLARAAGGHGEQQLDAATHRGAVVAVRRLRGVLPGVADHTAAVFLMP